MEKLNLKNVIFGANFFSKTQPEKYLEGRKFGFMKIIEEAIEKISFIFFVSASYNHILIQRIVVVE